MPETLGSGAAFLDYDGDGSPDLLLVNSDWWSGQEGSGERLPSASTATSGMGGSRTGRRRRVSICRFTGWARPWRTTTVTATLTST